MRVDSPESQISDMQANKNASEKDDRLAASLQTEEDQILQKKREAKFNKSNKSLINYQAIQSILKAEMQTEKDKDIQLAILQQLELLEAILEFKYLDKKEKLDTKLQKQVQEIIPAQRQIQEQKQPKTYAQILQTNTQEKKSQDIRAKTQKSQQKQKQVKEYKEKRLVIQTTQEEVANLNSYHLRNQINDKFFQKEGLIKPVVATVTKSFTGFSIILTTMPGYSADFLIQKKAVWGELVDKIAKKVEKDIHWDRIVIHGVPIMPFSSDEGLDLLKEEIEIFNPQLKLMKKPSWLISEENRQHKMHASIVIAIENAEQANFALHNKLCIAGL